MSALTWDQVLAEQQQRARVLSPARMRAELQWAEITKSDPPGLTPLPATWWTPPAPAPSPRSPRGRGARKAKTPRIVAVERRRAKLIPCPNGAILATKRTARSYLTIAA